MSTKEVFENKFLYDLSLLNCSFAHLFYTTIYLRLKKILRQKEMVCGKFLRRCGIGEGCPYVHVHVALKFYYEVTIQTTKLSKK